MHLESKMDWQQKADVDVSEWENYVKKNTKARKTWINASGHQNLKTGEGSSQLCSWTQWDPHEKVLGACPRTSSTYQAVRPWSRPIETEGRFWQEDPIGDRSFSLTLSLSEEISKYILKKKKLKPGWSFRKQKTVDRPGHRCGKVKRAILICYFWQWRQSWFLELEICLIQRENW